MGYIKRDLEPVIKRLTKQYPVILLTGPRQVGKTTMLKRMMETTRTYVTLDDLTVRALAKNDPSMFFQLYKPPILIDEIQYAPELFPYIKILVDKNKNAGDFWLTGSQIFKLMEGVQESLAGRVALLSLSSLSQSEIYSPGMSKPFLPELAVLAEKQIATPTADTPEIYRRIYRGSMPAIVSGEYEDTSVFYASYLSTYLERDVKELSTTINSLKFFNFITAAASRCSQIVNVAEMARDADINQITAKNWLRILERLGIIFYLYPYSNNQLKRVIKAPKLYFFDSGLVCYLGRWSSPETAESGAMGGALLENYVVGELMKSYYNAAKTPFLYYYRDKDAKEIDVVIEADGKLMPMEIKKTASPDARMIKVFGVLDKANVTRGKGAILCMKETLSAIDSDNLIIPIYLI
ncbi:MAG: ATP-binding protein [Bacillota bacterium]